jgi:hypothetical protein
VSDPPLFGVVDVEDGLELVPDDPQPASTTATVAARTIGADRKNLRLWLVFGLTSTLLL